MLESSPAAGGAVGERVRRYIMDGGDEDLRRLLSIGDVIADRARTSLRNVGVEPGWNVVDCGCGPIGGLAVLAEMVGPSGRVVGFDFNEEAVQRARSIARTLELENVEVFVEDLGRVDAAALGGPFDLAFSRFFLMHQPDPVAALSRIAGLLRPGGWIVAHEPLPTPPPRSHPGLDALAGYWELLHGLLARAGVPDGAVDDLPRSARAAGLEVVTVSGFFEQVEPELGFELHALNCAGAKAGAVASGAATEQEVDELIGALREARHGDRAWVSSPFFTDMAFRKPSS
jgi:SAM-dependent methyltransferase